MSDTRFILGQALAVGLDLQERFAGDDYMRNEGENIATAARNALRRLPFVEAQAGAPPPMPPVRHLRLVDPVDDPRLDV